MRKISINCRFPGILYRARIADLLVVTMLFCLESTSSRSQAGEIALPPPPDAAPPPTLPRDKDPVVIRKIEQIEDKESQRRQVELDKEVQIKKKATEKAKNEAQERRPLYGFFEVSLLQPKAIVSGNRTDYHCDMTSHISGYARILLNKQPEDVQPWIGLRIAPFGGYGIQKNFSGRFAHTFIGPSIGFGRISKPDDPISDSPSRSLWLWSGGIAGVSKLVSREDGVKTAPSDFKASSWSYETPGLWSEVRWTRITRGAMGYGALLGLQTGKGKSFFYAGFSGSGFY